MNNKVDQQLHFFLFPFMSHGHMLPTLDIAKLLASHGGGVKATIITTPLSASYFSKSIPKEIFGSRIAVRTIDFPAAAVTGLPENCEKTDQLPSPDMFPLFLKATAMLQHPFNRLLRECRPDCVVADLFFPWVTPIADKLGIPTVVFYAHGVLPNCAAASLEKFQPQFKVSDDDETFVVPNLPLEITATRSELPPHLREKKKAYMEGFVEKVSEAEAKSFGVLINGFYELEHEFADHYREVLGMRAWFIGPAFLHTREDEKEEDKVLRGGGGGYESSISQQHECLKWLDSKDPDSVIYVCFGTTVQFSEAQLNEFALGLEASDQHFVWVVGGNPTTHTEWLPEGFEERNKDKCLIIKGWAPQVLILDHQATGAFMTHCGWNSTLEGVCAGLPLVTCPGFADQFWNEKLVTRVWRIGVRIRVGANKWGRRIEGIGREEIADAVKKVIIGDEAEEMRKRAKVLKDEAKKAIEEGGSSYSDLNALLQDIASYRATSVTNIVET